MEKRTKVLFLITKSNWGGAQRYVFDLATNVPKEQFDVAVAAGGRGILLTRLESAGIRTISIRHLERDVTFFSDIRAFVNIARIISREKPDVLHLNSSKIGALGALIGRIYGVKTIIFTAHGWAFAEDRNALSKILIKAINWFTILLAHHSIAISARMKKEMASFPGVDSKVVVIHNGLQAFKLLSRDAANLAFMSIMNGLAERMNTSRIGTIAELHPIKGLSYAVEAIAKLRDRGIAVTFIIIGEGEERARLEHKIKELRLENSVSLLGFLPDAERYLKAFDIFVMSSLYEGLNFSVLEAGLAELPVVASNVGGMPEIIEDNVSGTLVPARDSSALADALKKLIDSPSDRAELGAQLAERVRRDFSLDEMIRRTIALYAH